MEHLEVIDWTVRRRIVRALRSVADEISRCGITDVATPTYVVESITNSIYAACDELEDETS